MAQVSLSPEVKDMLTRIKESDGHTSLDSVVRTLIERSKMTDDYRTMFEEMTSGQLQEEGGVNNELTNIQPINQEFDNEVQKVVHSLPDRSQLVLFTILSIESSEHNWRISDELIYHTHIALVSDTNMDPIPKDRIIELVSELDMCGLIAADISVQSGEREIIDVRTIDDRQDIMDAFSWSGIDDIDDPEESIQPVLDNHPNNSDEDVGDNQ